MVPGEPRGEEEALGRALNATEGIGEPKNVFGWKNKKMGLDCPVEESGGEAGKQGVAFSTGCWWSHSPSQVPSIGEHKAQETVTE